MTVEPGKHVVVVDGSNLATEGRTTPSLQQLDEAVRAYATEDPDAEIVVVVDASFEHRIDPEERKQLVDAELHGEIVSPPAGAIGRGDAFVLRIAERTGATVLSNDSFQEFHGEHPWLFDKGRLVGGKPVPGIGWIFTPRLPVRGPKSRQASGKAKGEDAQALSLPVKAAELAKAAKKIAARKAPVLPDGSTPKVGDVWPAGAPSAAGASQETAKKKVKKGEAKDASQEGAKAKEEKRAAATATPGDGAAEVAAATGKKKAAKKVAPAPTAKKATPAVTAKKEAPQKKLQAKKAEPAKTAEPAKAEAAKKTVAAKKGEPAKKAALATREVVKKEAATADVLEAGTKKAAAKEAAPTKAAKVAEPAKKAGPAKKAEAAKKAVAAKKAEPAKKAVAVKKAQAAKKAVAKGETSKQAAATVAAKAAPKKATLAPETANGAAKAKAARSTATKNPAVQEAIGQALAEAIAPVAPKGEDGRRGRGDQKRGKQDGKGARHRRRRATSPPPAVNEPLAFITFVASYPCDSALEGEVVSFTSHGAMVDVELPGGGVLHCYIPLTAMGDPPPTKARQVLRRGERRRFVLVALDPQRRVAELALPELVAAQVPTGR